MSDSDDRQLKNEIDGIMENVKNIMQKIDALTPENETEIENKEDTGDHLNSSDMSSTEST